MVRHLLKRCAVHDCICQLEFEEYQGWIINEGRNVCHGPAASVGAALSQGKY